MVITKNGMAQCYEYKKTNKSFSKYVVVCVCKHVTGK